MSRSLDHDHARSDIESPLYQLLSFTAAPGGIFCEKSSGWIISPKISSPVTVRGEDVSLVVETPEKK